MSDVPVPGGLEIHQTKDGTKLVLALSGELDLGSTPVLERELSNPAADSCRHIVVDLTQLAFIDSQGVRALLQAQRKAQSRQKAFSLRRGGRQVQRLFEVTGFSALLTFETNHRTEPVHEREPSVSSKGPLRA
jgi:anti-anti-sigma factor